MTAVARNFPALGGGIGTFVERLIDITVTLGSGDFGEAGSGNKVKLSGLRCTVNVVKTGTPGSDTAQISIFGLTLPMMNKLSTLGMPQIRTRDNTVLVEAGTSNSHMATVFSGTIWEAWADLNRAPEVSFEISAMAGLLDAQAPAAPTSVKGPVDAMIVLRGLAQRMLMPLEVRAATAILSSPYVTGSLRDQALRIAHAAGLVIYFDHVTGRMVVLTKDEARTGAPVLISKKTGMRGYPKYTGTGVEVDCLFNPTIKFLGLVQIDSIITPACGIWTVNALSHSLASKMPNGPWFTTFKAYRLGNPATIVQ